MKFSIITVSFHDLAGLEKTRASVLRQETTAEVEHIVIDGGSGQLVSDFLRRQGGMMWRSEPDMGRYDAMNKGIALATGDLLWFMNSGDTFGSEFSLDQVRASLAGQRYVECWGYGFGRWIEPGGQFGRIIGSAPFRLGFLVTGLRPLPHQAAFVGRSIVDRIGGYSLEFPIAADQLFMIEAAKIVPPIIVPEFLCNYDSTGVSSGQSVRKHFSEMRRVLRRSGVRITRFHFIDVVISYFFEAYRTLQRVLRTRH